MMIVQRIRAGLLLFLAFAALTAHSQVYPTKPVRLIVPFAPGGTTEVLARIIGQKLGEQLGQQVIIDNRPGASGSLGTTIAAKSSPDGYTLLLTSLSPIVINVNMYAGKGPYDPEKDLAPISLITKVPSVITTPSATTFRTVKDIIAAAKANPNRLSYGSSGTGSVNHLIGELFRLAAGIELLHIPYRGAGPAMIALLSKEVDMIIASPVAIMSQVRSGKVRAIAVSGAKRAPALPDVPTISESGVPGFDFTAWYCMMAPAGTPRPIIEKVRNALAQAIQTPAVTERLNAEGAVPEPTTPEELLKLIRSDRRLWAKAVEISGAKLD
jgi:tripartite-type tricarboxylate transporter receptor subunit TctC